MTYLQSQTELLFEQLPNELQSVFRILRLNGHEVYINDISLNLTVNTKDDYVIEVIDYPQLHILVWKPINCAADILLDKQQFNNEFDCADYIDAIA